MVEKKAAADKSGYEKPKGVIWAPKNPGDFLIGRVIDRFAFTKEGNQYPTHVYKVQSGDVLYSVFGNANIPREMENVPNGREVRIELVELKKNDKNEKYPIQVFEVLVKKQG